MDYNCFVFSYIQPGISSNVFNTLTFNVIDVVNEDSSSKSLSFGKLGSL